MAIYPPYNARPIGSEQPAPNAVGQPQAQAMGGVQPYGALPQSIQNQFAGAQQLQQTATANAPHSSGLVNGMQALAGYMGGRAQNQAAQAAAPYQGQAEQDGQSLLAQILRSGGNGSGSPQSSDSGTATAYAPDYSGPTAGQGGFQDQIAALKSSMVGRKSDRRLKSDVTRIGALPCGLAVYRYRLEGGPFEVGCMADEVALVRPDATWIDSGDGFARVDYSRLVP